MANFDSKIMNLAIFWPRWYQLRIFVFSSVNSVKPDCLLDYFLVLHLRKAFQRSSFSIALAKGDS